MSVYSKAEFKKLWESDRSGGGITFEDVADCARDWGLYATPRIVQLDLVLEKVLLASEVEIERD